MWLGYRTRPDFVKTRAAFRSNIAADLFRLASETFADRDGEPLGDAIVGRWQHDLDTTLYRPIRFLPHFDIDAPAIHGDGEFSRVAAIIDATEIRIMDHADESSAAAAMNILAAVGEDESDLGNVMKRDLPLLLGEFATGPLNGSTIILVDRYVRNPLSWNATEYDATVFLKFAAAQPKAALVLANLADSAFFPVPTPSGDAFPSPRRERRVAAAWRLLARRHRIFPLGELRDGRFPCLAIIKKRGFVADEVERSLDECSTDEGVEFRRTIQRRHSTEEKVTG